MLGLLKRKEVKKMAETLKQKAKRLLADVPNEYVFRCHDGLTLQSMKELGNALNSMADETYVFHANTEKNDFTNWVRDIIKDYVMAKDLQKVTNRTQAAKLVASRIAILSKRFA
jgi:hypothetical protein